MKPLPDEGLSGQVADIIIVSVSQQWSLFAVYFGAKSTTPLGDGLDR